MVKPSVFAEDTNVPGEIDGRKPSHVSLVADSVHTKAGGCLSGGDGGGGAGNALAATPAQHARMEVTEVEVPVMPWQLVPLHSKQRQREYTFRHRCMEESCPLQRTDASVCYIKVMVAGMQRAVRRDSQSRSGSSASSHEYSNTPSANMDSR